VALTPRFRLDIPLRIRQSPGLPGDLLFGRRVDNLGFYLGMIFSENRFPLFGIMP
jgi:hypothetical protein